MTARIEVHIASHYQPERTVFLETVLQAIAGWRGCSATVALNSNTDAYHTTGLIARQGKLLADKGHAIRLEVAARLEDPFMLTWHHKRFIPQWLARGPAADDLFIYIEDDIVLTDANLRYLRRTLPLLKDLGLIPGLMRYEIKDGVRRLVDITRREKWQGLRSLAASGQLFHANANPYWAGFVLTPELAVEYMASRSFTPEGSRAVKPWDIRERSAMGLSFENPPAGLESRCVIPIVGGLPDEDCLVWHCANTYSAANHPMFGRLTLEQAYGEAPLRNALRRLLKI